jgi:CRISPR-associated endoribonuclease Cas6
MRVKIELKAETGKLKIPFNYNYIISSMIYNNISDSTLAYELHSTESFKFFTFSQLNIHEYHREGNDLISENGAIDFIISSPNEYLLKNIIRGFLENLTVNFIGQKLNVKNVEIIEKPEFTNQMEFRTLSPIIARVKREVDGEKKIWDLTPGEEFFKQLEKNLINKYLKFNNINETDKKIKIYSEMRKVKRRRICIKKNGFNTYHRSYFMDINMIGDPELIEFAYECGLGEKNSMGFGCINIYNRQKK